MKFFSTIKNYLSAIIFSPLRFSEGRDNLYDNPLLDWWGEDRHSHDYLSQANKFIPPANVPLSDMQIVWALLMLNKEIVFLQQPMKRIPYIKKWQDNLYAILSVLVLFYLTPYILSLTDLVFPPALPIYHRFLAGLFPVILVILLQLLMIVWFISSTSLNGRLQYFMMLACQKCVSAVKNLILFHLFSYQDPQTQYRQRNCFRLVVHMCI